MAAMRKKGQMEQFSAELKSIKQAVARSASQSKTKKTKTKQGVSPKIPKTMSGAAAYAVGIRQREPMIKGNYRSTRIQHKELIASIVGTTAFSILPANTFALNPGLATSFPWLSTQAAGWEQYKFHKLKFCFLTRTSTATPGSCMLIPDYDAADSAPLTEQIASAYRDVVEEAPWIPEFCLSLDPKSMMEPGNRKFIRTGPLASNLDVKTYDSGVVYIATTDGTAVNWGKLWVEYDVEFFIPQLPPAGSVVAQTQVSTGASVNVSAIFGTSPVYLYGAQNLFSVSANTLVFNLPGDYLVVFDNIGATPFSVPAFSGTFAAANSFFGGTTSSSGSTSWSGAWSFQISAAGQYVNFTTAGGGAGTTTTLVVTPITPSQYLVL